MYQVKSHLKLTVYTKAKMSKSLVASLIKWTIYQGKSARALRKPLYICLRRRRASFAVLPSSEFISLRSSNTKEG